MSALDWAIVVVYALVVIGIGTWATRRQAGTDEYFRGSRKLPWWAVGVSLIATAFSAASFLGGPGEGYFHGLKWIQLQVGDLAGYVLVCVFFIPVFVRLDITTAYEYLERRFDAKTRALGAFCFLLFVLARLGALLYGASLVFAKVSGVPIEWAILVVGVVSIGYTVAGGIAAVVWTDVLQFVMILIGVGVAVAVAANGAEGGVAGVMKIAAETDRLRPIDPSWDPSSIRTLPTAVLAYGTLSFAVAATNQQTVQRYICCDRVNDARKAVMLGWLTGFIGMAGTLLLGVFLFAFYATREGALPADVKPDAILGIFIADELPVGAAGLLVAAVFAAAMSSIDSALHSLSTCLVVDGYRRFLVKDRPDAHYLRVARGLIVFWGLAGIAAAFYVASTGKSLLPFLVTYTAYTVGPLLGLFLLGVFVRRANGHGAFAGAILAVVAVVAIMKVGTATGRYEIPGIWFSALAAPLAVLFGAVVSLPFAPPAPEQLALGSEPTEREL